METVFAAFVAMLLLLTGVLTLSESVFTAADSMTEEVQSMETRWDERSRTRLSFIDGATVDSGGRVLVTVENTGTTALADFAAWDAIVEYMDVFNRRRVEYLPYSAENPLIPHWVLDSLSLPPHIAIDEDFSEVYEVGIFNPGERATFSLTLPAATGFDVPIRVTFAAHNGTVATATVRRNAPPILSTLIDFEIGANGSRAIDPARLLVMDTDNSPDELVYTVTQAPVEGTLSLPGTFTQADVDAGLLIYQHGTAAMDEFSFTITDGQETIGPFTLQATLNQPPVLNASLGASGLPLTPIVITNSLLGATDPDDLAAGLRYSVVVPPAVGFLSLGSSFTQGQIDAGELTYTGAATDSFQYTITDGYTTVGPFTFLITVIP